jgi:hypothetical protein
VVVACCLAAPTAFGQEQIFEKIEEYNVPGIGFVRARVGVSPRPLVQCEVRSRFSASQRPTTPLVAYVIADRTSTHAAPYTIEFLSIVPNGPYKIEKQQARFDKGVARNCHTRPFDKGDPPFQLGWSFNDADVGIVSFDKD